MGSCLARWAIRKIKSGGTSKVQPVRWRQLAIDMWEAIKYVWPQIA